MGFLTRLTAIKKSKKIDIAHAVLNVSSKTGFAKAERAGILRVANKASMNKTIEATRTILPKMIQTVKDF